MIAYPDTSFLYAIYRPQSKSPAALAHYQAMDEPLHVTGLLLFEFRQSLRLQAFRWKSDRGVGVSGREFAMVVAGLEADLENGILVRAHCDWDQVLKDAESLSSEYTLAGGYRTLDILHVATAKYLGAEVLLTFDATQRTLARLAGLKNRS